MYFRRLLSQRQPVCFVRFLAQVYQYMRQGDLHHRLVKDQKLSGSAARVAPAPFIACLAHAAGGFASADWPACVLLCLEAAKGIAYMHSERIVHRDFALRNLLVDESGHGASVCLVGSLRLLNYACVVSCLQCAWPISGCRGRFWMETAAR
jgi:serine/threonine protein kinase